MCIIAYKPAGVNMPTTDIFYSCFFNNPDGAGLMYVDRGVVKIKKGFMSVNDLFDGLEDVGREVKKPLFKLNVVLHFRFATQGYICSENCHPFPCASSEEQLTGLELETDIGVAHNGVISFCSDKKNSDLSDTQLFIRDYLSRIPGDVLFNPAIIKLLFEATNSKFAIMSPIRTELIGSFVKYKGVLYSNSSYRPDDGCFSNSKKKKNYDFCCCCGEYTRGNYYHNMWICPDCKVFIDDSDLY